MKGMLFIIEKFQTCELCFFWRESFNLLTRACGFCACVCEYVAVFLFSFLCFQNILFLVFDEREIKRRKRGIIIKRWLW